MSQSQTTPARKLRACADRTCPSYGELFHAEHASAPASQPIVPVQLASKGYCQHGDHGIAALVPASYRETAGAKRYLCERHALPAIAEFGVSK